MIALDDSSIIIGEIKQLLHTFNLPNCKLNNKFPYEGRHFITKNQIKTWKKNLSNQLVEKFVDNYIVNKHDDNFTTTLPIHNMLYDRQTHRYLGHYLRFLREYFNLNLMSMYNCFDAESSDLEATFKQGTKIISFNNNTIKDTIVYKVPISLVPQLTISAHNAAKLELCLAINASSDAAQERQEILMKASYKAGKFNQSFIYDLPLDGGNLKNETDASKKAQMMAELTQTLNRYSENICLLIKVPAALKTSITVLEGNYISTKLDAGSYLYFHPWVASETDPSQFVAADYYADNFKIMPQLLSHENAHKNYLLADNLLQYLDKNSITNISEHYDIKHVQLLLDDLRKSDNSTLIPANKLPQARRSGIWNDSDFIDLKNLTCQASLNKQYDTIGYFDKDLELKYLQKFDELAATDQLNRGID